MQLSMHFASGLRIPVARLNVRGVDADFAASLEEDKR